MSTILTIYSSDAFQRILLPAMNDADYAILLSDNLFHIGRSVELQLEVVDDQWRFKDSQAYELRYLSSDQPCTGVPLCAEESGIPSVYRLLLDGQHVISIIAAQTRKIFSVYQQYSLLSAPPVITIGRDPEQMIRYNYEQLNLVSAHHAQLVRTQDGWMFQDLSSRNGSYLNHQRVQTAPLRFGDCLDIFGLRIVFLGTTIAINGEEVPCTIQETLLHRQTPQPLPRQKRPGYQVQEIFHRSPRITASIDEDEVRIDDAPPAKEEVRNSSVIAAMGSVMSMSLPMLLGCAFMIFASNQSGMNRGLFMYVGVVTAASSALLGTIRSVRAMRQSRKEYETSENQRNERYGAYLQGRENLIREKYEKNTAALRRNHVSAEECCTYTSANPALWSRNIQEAHFLDYRLGLGEQPFQVSIKVPDQKFSLSDNHLSDIPQQISQTYRLLHDVPVTIDLAAHRLVGIVGGRHLTGCLQIVANLAAQAAANNAYTDVKLVFIYDESSTGLGTEWNFAKWLPHVWNETETFRYLASNKEEAGNVSFELNKVIRARLENPTPGSDAEEYIAKPYYLLFVASPELLEGELIQPYILHPEPIYGLCTFVLAQRYEDLPNECSFIIENDETYQGMYNISDDMEKRTAIRFDQIDASSLEKFSANLANVRVRETESGGDIPQTVTFFEMYGIHHLEELQVLNRWKKNRTYESMRALIGQMAGGAPCYLDIHEKYHGPHGLVAGTTGSGKSETLQTYILSLAINFSPDDVAFFIIDYKGGGMANLFENLPHMIGQISNLSGNQVNRALLAIQSEKDRREAIFKEYGVKDIRDYTRLYKRNETSVPLPHLIIVIDEFAEMKKEQPEFIQEIVSVSRVGRSLGIHLIMATQKPAGSVSEDIWSNSRFKLCLRVQSRQDSMDMLHKPDAAYVTQTGRAYLEVGNDELYELFQSGFSGAAYTEDDDDGNSVATMLEEDGIPVIEGSHNRIVRAKERKRAWIRTLLSVIQQVSPGPADIFRGTSHDARENVAMKVFDVLAEEGVDFPFTEQNKEGLITLLGLVGELGYDEDNIISAEEGFTSAKEKLPQQPQRTQLEVTVAYLQELAKKNGYNHDFSLFLPLLPKSITLAQLPKAALPWDGQHIFNGRAWPAKEGKLSLAVSMGLYDDPENQRQDTVVLDLLRCGSIALFGAASSGKTTFLQTFLYGLVMRYSPAELHVYAMEYSARKLSPFAVCPQVGGILLDTDDNDRIDKFFIMLSGILKDRKKSLGDITFETYLQIHGMGSMPAVVILIDNFAQLVTRVQDKYNALLSRLLKEGLANGIYLVVTAAGTGNGEIPNSLAQNFRTTLTLEMNNAFDYANYMRDSHLHLRPETNIKGRGLVRVGERILEFQTALAMKAPNDQALGDMIRTTAQAMRACWTKDGAPGIPSIPENPVWAEFRDLPATRKLLQQTSILPFGYDARHALPYGVDLATTYVYMISGARKKGKTNLLKILMLSAKEKGGQIVIIDYHNEFAKISTQLNAVRLVSELDWFDYLKNHLLGEVSRRNQAKAKIREQADSDAQIFEAMQKFEKIYIFVDGLPDFINRCYKPTQTIPQTYFEIMETILDKCTLHNIFWFVTINKADVGVSIGTRLYKNFVRDKKGIHLGGAVHATAMPEMNFDNHNRRGLDDPKPVGRGMIPMDNESNVLEVVIPKA